MAANLAEVSGFMFQKSHKKLYRGKARHNRSLSLWYVFLIINPSIFLSFSTGLRVSFGCLTHIKTLRLSFPYYFALSAYLLLSPAGSIGTPWAAQAPDIVGWLLHQEGRCLVPTQSLSTGVTHCYLLRNQYFSNWLPQSWAFQVQYSFKLPFGQGWWLRQECAVPNSQFILYLKKHRRRDHHCPWDFWEGAERFTLCSENEHDQSAHCHSMTFTHDPSKKLVLMAKLQTVPSSRMGALQRQQLPALLPACKTA